MRKAVALLLTATMLVACSKAPPAEAPATAAPADPALAQGAGGVTTIRVLSFDHRLESLISAYHAKYPLDRVKTINPLSDSAGSVNVGEVASEMIERGEIDVLSHPLMTHVKAGQILPLDPLIQKEGFDLTPFGPALESLRYEGKLYQLPYSVYPEIIAFNKAMLEEAGLTPPTQGWTWDDLRAMAQKLTHGEGDQRIWGFAPETPERAVSLFVSQGGGHRDEQPVKDAFQLFGTLTQVDQSVPKPKRHSAGAPFTYDPSFVNRKAAMTLIGAGDLLTLFERRESFPIDVAPVPVRPGGRPYGYAMPESFGIAATSPNQDAAWRFVQFVAGPEGAALLAKAGSVPIYNTPAVRAAWFEQQPPPPPNSEFLFETSWVFPSSTPSGTPLSPAELERSMQLYEELTDLLNAVMSGEKSWEDGFAEYQQALKGLKQ